MPLSLGYFTNLKSASKTFKFGAESILSILAATVMEGKCLIFVQASNMNGSDIA
jgi:hypothetical protein